MASDCRAYASLPTVTRRKVLRSAGVAAAFAVVGGHSVARRATGQGTPAGGLVDVDAAKGEGTVSLYTSLDTKIVDAIVASFKAQYGIDVEYFRGGSADVSGRVLAEADAGNIQADIVDASDVGAFLAMKERGLLKPYRSPVAESVPPELRDADDMWVADRLTQAVIQFNTQELGGLAPPQRWEDLTGPDYEGRLTYFSSSNGDGAPRLFTLAQHFGWELLEEFAANGPLRVETPQLVAQVVENGERTAGFATNDNIAWRSKQEGKPTDFVYPQQGVPTELGAVGLLEGAAHPNAAMLFYDWWMGEEGMRLLIEGGKYSSRTDLGPPTGSPPLGDLNLLVLDYQEYQTNRAEILERMAEVFGGEWGV
jgi:iron(III) transport system substrate-binding protein